MRTDGEREKRRKVQKESEEKTKKGKINMERETGR